MKFDDVLKHIGEFGPYQKRVYMLAVIPAMLVGFETFSVIFIFNIPYHRCALPGFPNDNSYHPHDENHSLLINHSVPITADGHYDQCHLYTDAMHDVIWNDVVGLYDMRYNVSYGEGNGSDVTTDSTSPHFARGRAYKCSNWVFDNSTFESTIATDFQVVCDRSVYRPSSNMFSEIGTLVGVFVCGFLADRFGRKVPFYVGGVALIGGGFGIAFCQSLIALNVCRFILGISRMAVFVNGLVVGMEIVGPSKRVFTGLFVEIMWCLGELILLLSAYFVRQWRYLELGLGVASIFLMGYWWLIPESPRWLATKGREDEAFTILKKIAAANKTSLPKIKETKDLFEKPAPLTWRHVFKSRELRVRMAIVYSNMFVVAMVYYGLSLNVTNLHGDIFINFLIMSISAIIGFSLPMFLLDRIGRKPAYCASILLSGLTCIVSVIPVLIGAPDYVIVVICMVGRLFVCSAYGIIYVYGAEVFPTVIRASSIGAATTFSRFGSIISPYLADIGILVGGRYEQALPLIVMGTPALLVGFFSLWLTETKGGRLPETLKDLEASSVRTGMCGCSTKSADDVGEITIDVVADDEKKSASPSLSASETDKTSAGETETDEFCEPCETDKLSPVNA